jgi:hypothetical protein
LPPRPLRHHTGIAEVVSSLAHGRDGEAYWPLCVRGLRGEFALAA